MAEEKTCIGIWWGNTEGNRPLERSNCRWEDNNRIDVTELG